MPVRPDADFLSRVSGYDHISALRRYRYRFGCGLSVPGCSIKMIQLPLHFIQQLPLGRQVQTVRTGKNLLLVFGSVNFTTASFLSAQSRMPIGRIFTGELLHPVIVIYIHLEPSDILVGQLVDFDFYDHKVQKII